MARTGVDNPGRAGGEPGDPEPLEEWIAAGIPRDDAELWRNWRFRLRSAMAWRQAGVLDGLRAAQWTTAGATPETVGQWTAAGISATEAVSWHEFGFSLAEARRHKSAGRSPHDAFAGRRPSAPSPMGFAAVRPPPGFMAPPGPIQRFIAAGARPEVMHSYMTRHWVDDEAAAWAKEGIEAAEANLWKALGVRPGEAGRLVKQGLSVAETLKNWWRAGIPVDEVADWIGAGLSPEEAATQRARGITAEQAAALRALRDDAGE
ncbi:MAG: hypothetical protein J2O39_03120 [Acidimicrobiales bacterium]|nr:hypothetical protein [Acidimicrobiales bacterium]MBO0887015.1 hypothetical protein [Acidimicrobiales bacterium]MBO0893344.1 hypothetical protein [Acidimicrobiales bacterium]